MTQERPAYLGPRLRRLRRDLGLTQPGMAADLGVSVSYVSLLESNQRPVTAEMLLRLARTYRIDVADFAGDGGAAFTTRLQRALKNPLFADIDLPALQAADVATNFPGITEAFLRLHSAYSEAQLALADRQADPRHADPAAEVRQFLADRRNCLPRLDEAAEALADMVAQEGGLADAIARRHGLRVRIVPPDLMGGMIRRHDPHRATLFLDESLDGPARRFQLALQLAYLALNAELDAALAEGRFSSDNAHRMARRAVANYAAAAIVMPCNAFTRAVDEKRYDIEALARRFDASFEQVAHRLTTLQKPGGERVAFFFVRVDPAGNVSKRLPGAGFPFASQGGCAQWNLHRAFAAPGRIVTQWLELPGGERFFSVARTVVSGGGGFATPRVARAVALVCAADDAPQLTYAGSGLPDAFTPIGITCTLCQRDACPARAAPPIGRQILPDDYHRRPAPFSFADD